MDHSLLLFASVLPLFCLRSVPFCFALRCSVLFCSVLFCYVSCCFCFAMYRVASVLLCIVLFLFCYASCCFCSALRLRALLLEGGRVITAAAAGRSREWKRMAIRTRRRMRAIDPDEKKERKEGRKEGKPKKKKNMRWRRPNQK
jgi:hypothetical protein